MKIFLASSEPSLYTSKSRKLFIKAIHDPRSSILDLRSSLLLRGLRGFNVFEEFVNSILIDFDLALIFVSFAGRFGERVVSLALTLVEEGLSNALAVLREFGQIGLGSFLGGEDQV